MLNMPADGSYEDGTPMYKYDGAEYRSAEVYYYPRGRIVYYGNIASGICHEPLVLIPGIAILPKGFLAVVYATILIYLFLGIAIISELFMGGIE
jgi:hypothetical protein